MPDCPYLRMGYPPDVTSREEKAYHVAIYHNNALVYDSRPDGTGVNADQYGFFVTFHPELDVVRVQEDAA